MLNKMRLELEEKFNCKFKIKESNELIEILCNDKKIEDNNEALDEIIKIAAKYLDEERLWDIGVAYDYLNEIPSIKKQIETSVELEPVKNSSKNIICSDLKLNIEKTILNSFIVEKDNSTKLKGLKFSIKHKLDDIITLFIGKKCNCESSRLDLRYNASNRYISYYNCDMNV
ncbi:hypothetical protein GM168_10310 [Clostridium perfringens]|uniref:Uncharacterized protein n=1 Tax=Clostridium perfringens TaxID=1502 RepID=A0AAP4EGL1_CLOPF|nr:hypothetical protein [Clostridium perfringens]EGT2192203.1 hypothetical protein [Clostridium perfringens]EHA0993945.1 hypothetical protein [Clostridium perfringens]EHA1184779.1 hypothetical protein [Clostridium perfringens]EJT6143116.1 hypothetical protein [Clostridium perfringens]MDH2337489.1 hypothetical protein [Clostridium perfringens]